MRISGISLFTLHKMFLKDLFNYSKPAFFWFIIFLVSFAFLNFKWGLVAAPIYQYGMYSQRMFLRDTQTVYKIYINNKELALSKYTFTERDKLLGSLVNYKRSHEANELVYVNIKNVLSKAYVGKLMDRKTYVKDTINDKFTIWYNELLQQKVKESIKKVVVSRSYYTYTLNGIQQISPPENIYSFGTE